MMLIVPGFHFSINEGASMRWPRIVRISAACCLFCLVVARPVHGEEWGFFGIVYHFFKQPETLVYSGGKVVGKTTAPGTPISKSTRRQDGWVEYDDSEDGGPKGWVKQSDLVAGDAAISFFQRNVDARTEPRYFFARRLASVLHDKAFYSDGRWEDVTAACRKLLPLCRTQKERTSCKCDLAGSLEHAGQPLEAISVYEQVIEEDASAKDYTTKFIADVYYKSLKDNDKAIELYSQLVGRNPAKYLQDRAELYEKIGKINEAADDYVKLLELGSEKKPDLRTTKAINALHKAKRWSDAERLLDANAALLSAFELASLRAKTFRGQGKTALALEQNTIALDSRKWGASLSDDHATLLRERAQLQLDAKQFQEVLATCALLEAKAEAGAVEALFRLQGKDNTASAITRGQEADNRLASLQYQARAFEGLKDISRAASCLKDADGLWIKSEPKGTAMLRALAALFSRQRDWNAMSTALVQVVDRDSSAEWMRPFLKGLEDKQQAVGALTKILAKHPKNHLLLDTRASIFLELEDHDSARADCEDALALSPENPDYLFTLADVYFGQKNWQEAIKAFTNFIRKRPELYGGYWGRGDSYMRAGQFTAAKRDLERSNELAKSKDPNVIAALGLLLASAPDESIRDSKSAMELTQAACESSSWKEPYPIASLAAAWAESGDFDKAAKLQRQAIEGYRAKNASSKSLGVEGRLEMEEMTARLELYEAHKPYRLPAQTK